MSQEELHPLAAEVGSQLKDPSQTFQMLVYFVVHSGQELAMEKAFHQPLLQTVKEEGNYTYRLLQQTTQPENFIVVEHWQNLAALDSHLKQPYLSQLLEDLGPVLAQPPRVDVFQEIVAR
ncbi:MAG: antibiotic biosynthesis monooxygenase [Planctomycetaceae bacterium]|nr:antibiotic biosynthesis monooxygenase [Planctomycetaceae bacterium]